MRCTTNDSFCLSFRVCLSASSFFFFYGIVGDKGCRNVDNVETRVYVFMSIIYIDVDHVEINLLIYAFVERKCDGNNFYCMT